MMDVWSRPYLPTPFSTSFTQLAVEYPSYQHGSTQDFFLLKGEFFLATVVCWGQILGFYKAPSNNF